MKTYSCSRFGSVWKIPAGTFLIRFWLRSLKNNEKNTSLIIALFSYTKSCFRQKKPDVISRLFTCIAESINTKGKKEKRFMFSAYIFLAIVKEQKYGTWRRWVVSVLSDLQIFQNDPEKIIFLVKINTSYLSPLSFPHRLILPGTRDMLMRISATTLKLCTILLLQSLLLLRSVES